MNLQEEFERKKEQVLKSYADYMGLIKATFCGDLDEFSILPAKKSFK